MVGSGDQAIEEGIYITRFARNVTVIVLHDEGILDCNRISAEKALCRKGMCFVWNSTIQEIKGKDTVESVVIKNVKTGETSELACQGRIYVRRDGPFHEISERKRSGNRTREDIFQPTS